MKIFKKIIIAIVLSPFIALFLYFGLNYIGFCFEKCRFLSDEEKIDRAIGRVLARMYTRYENGIYYPDPEYNITYLKQKRNGVDPLVSDEDIKNFKAENPNCCSLSKGYYKKNGEGYEISPKVRITGWTSDFVIVKLKYNCIDENGKTVEDFQSYLIPISNCGEEILSLNESLGF